MEYKAAVIKDLTEGSLGHSLELLENHHHSQNIELEQALVLYPQDRLFKRFLTYKKLINYQAVIKDLNEAIKEGFANLARNLGIYLSPGRVLKVEGDDYYSCGWLFNPRGELILEQKQIFLSNEEKTAGLSRGVELKLADTELGKLGFLLYTDCWYPEVGRFLALEGVDLILTINTLQNNNYWQQLAGVWSQVQQNQFFALEGSCRGIDLVHGPCEITPYRTGIIAPVGDEKLALSNQPDRYLASLAKERQKGQNIVVTEGIINLDRRAKAREKYDLMKQLNVSLYQKNGLENMLPGRRRGSDELGRDQG